MSTQKSVLLLHCPPHWLKTPPLALVFLSTYLKNQGVAVQSLDLNTSIFQTCALSPAQWLTLNDSFESSLYQQVYATYPLLLEHIFARVSGFDIIAFSLFGRNWPFARALAHGIAQRFPHSEIVMGGPHAFFLHHRNQLDSRYRWVVGEGELPLADIASGGTQRVYTWQEISDLDNLPFPDFSCVTEKAYSGAIPLLASRGCAFACNFCTERFLYRRIRRHSPRYMVECIERVQQRYGAQQFIFCDSMFNFDTAWLMEFCELLLRRPQSIRWEAQMRVNASLSNEMAETIKRSGCYNIFVGLESASPVVLTAMRKGFDVATAEKFFTTLGAGGLHFEVSLIVGHPSETQAEYEVSREFIRTHKQCIPKIAQINPHIDYLTPGALPPSSDIYARVADMVRMLEDEGIRYTKSYINNLAYGPSDMKL